MKKILIPVITIVVIAVFVIAITGRSPEKNNGDAPCGKTDAPCGAGMDVLKENAPLPDVKINRTIKNKTLTVTMFYTYDCPHCKDALRFFDELTGAANINAAEYGDAVGRYKSAAGDAVKIHYVKYEIKKKTENQDIFRAYAAEYAVETRGVPSIFIGAENITGFYKDRTPAQIVNAMLRLQGKPVAYETRFVKVPLLGEVDAAMVSLPLLTAVIGFLDGFNPCAMWVLFFLLGILVYAASRKKVLFIGMTFVIASGAVYFAFMAAWFNIFLVIGFGKIVTAILAAAAIGMGLVNMKELFFFRKGVSLMISDKAKPKLYKKVRALNKETNIVLMAVSTVLLAVFVNFIELACTAGFPALFTKILAERNETLFAKYSYMLAYNVFYVLPLLAIVIVFTITMGHFKLKESHAKVLKFASGIMMISLGLLLLIKPQLLL